MAQPSSLAEQIARTKNAFREALTLEQSGRLEGVKSPQIYTAELFGAKPPPRVVINGPIMPQPPQPISPAGVASPGGRRAIRGAIVFKSSAGGADIDQAGSVASSAPSSPLRNPLSREPSAAPGAASSIASASQVLSPASAAAGAQPDSPLADPQPSASPPLLTPEASSLDVGAPQERSSSRQQPDAMRTSQFVASLDLEGPSAGDVMARLQARFTQRRGSGSGTSTPKTVTSLGGGILSQDPALPAAVLKARRSSQSGAGSGASTPGKQQPSAVSLLAASMAAQTRTSMRASLLNRSVASEGGIAMSNSPQDDHPASARGTPAKTGLGRVRKEEPSVEDAVALFGSTDAQGAYRQQRDVFDDDGPGLGWIDADPAAPDPEPERPSQCTPAVRRSFGSIVLRPPPPPSVQGPVNVKVNEALAQPGVITGAMPRGAVQGALGQAGSAVMGHAGVAGPEAGAVTGGALTAALARASSMRR